MHSLTGSRGQKISGKSRVSVFMSLRGGDAAHAGANVD
jgi:hypothetical protein